MTDTARPLVAHIEKLLGPMTRGFAGDAGTLVAQFDDVPEAHGDPATVLAWLIPITNSEAGFIEQKGWSRFEDLLEGDEIDQFDLQRKSVA